MVCTNKYDNGFYKWFNNRTYILVILMTEKRFENRLNKDNVKFNTQNPVWDNEKEDAFNVFEMIDLLNNFHEENQELKQQEKRLYNYFRKCFDNVSEQGFQETWEVVKKYD